MNIRSDDTQEAQARRIAGARQYGAQALIREVQAYHKACAHTLAYASVQIGDRLARLERSTR